MKWNSITSHHINRPDYLCGSWVRSQQLGGSSWLEQMLPCVLVPRRPWHDMFFFQPFAKAGRFHFVSSFQVKKPCWFLLNRSEGNIHAGLVRLCLCACPSSVFFKGNISSLLRPANQYSHWSLSGWMQRSFFLLLVFLFKISVHVLECLPFCLDSLRAVLSLILGHWCVLCSETRLRRRCDFCPLGSRLDGLSQSASSSEQNHCSSSMNHPSGRLRSLADEVSSKPFQRRTCEWFISISQKGNQTWCWRNRSNRWNKDDQDICFCF